MKLISVNMEGARHVDRIVGLLEREKPDCICLQEMPSAFIPTLQALGYHSTFAPMMYDQFTAPKDSIGVGIATRITVDTTTRYYYGNTTVVLPYEKVREFETTSFPYIVSTVIIDEIPYVIATTHLPVTKDGLESPDQNDAIDILLQQLAPMLPHVLCGDMNMPRGYNTNYSKFTQRYTDTIPQTYTSSLDGNLHRLGTANPQELNAPIFDIYMVDYIFTQAPYEAQNVRLEFGVSDHAAIIADITKQN